MIINFLKYEKIIIITTKLSKKYKKILNNIKLYI